MFLFFPYSKCFEHATPHTTCILYIVQYESWSHTLHTKTQQLNAGGFGSFWIVYHFFSCPGCKQLEINTWLMLLPTTFSTYFSFSTKLHWAVNYLKWRSFHVSCGIFVHAMKCNNLYAISKFSILTIQFVAISYACVWATYGID